MAIKKTVREGVYKVMDKLFKPYHDHQRFTSVSKADQFMLSLKYRELARQGAPLPDFRDIGFSNFSQSDEDGILLFLFSILGVTNRRSVEVCAGDGIECNTANLIFYHCWSSLLVDGNSENEKIADAFYRRYGETRFTPPRFATAWVTAENINVLLSGNGFVGEVDLFSLDTDGVDYWLWKAMTVIQPRVVVVEYMIGWGAERAMTVPYRSDFVGDQSSEPYYQGASLPAFVKLAKEKGYRLVGCSRNCFNAFFVRNDLGNELLPEVSVASCIRTDAAYIEKEQKAMLVREWVEV